MPARARRGRRPLGSPDARRAVLDAARELFAELGFERTTMRAVAARAGVDPALIYHYFGDKDGLLFAALQPPVVCRPVTKVSPLVYGNMSVSRRMRGI